MPVIEALASHDVEAKVLQADRSVVLDFYQSTCPPCRALEPRDLDLPAE